MNFLEVLFLGGFHLFYLGLGDGQILLIHVRLERRFFNLFLKYDGILGALLSQTFNLFLGNLHL